MQVYHTWGYRKQAMESCDKLAVEDIQEKCFYIHVRLAHKCIMLGPPTIGVGATISSPDDA